MLYNLIFIIMNVYIDNKKLLIPPIGFRNTGAICYFNALIQCILSSKRFIKFVLELENEISPKDEFQRLTAIFTEFFRHIVNDQWNVTFTTKLLMELNSFSPNQSSSEYFIMLLDKFKLENLFQCKYNIQMTCQQCEYSKTITDDITYNVLINQSFDEFFQTKTNLENVLCDGCKQKTLYVEKRQLNGLSDMVAVSFNKYFHKHLISYPLSFRIGNNMYKMVGVVDHFGVLNAGHYVARAKRFEENENNENNENNEYYLFDDERVVKIDDEVFSKIMEETYMIFYEKIIFK